jgi:hypothetical protein
MTEPLFKDVISALTFAYRYSSQQYPVSGVSKLSKGQNIGNDKGLIGQDGAAQAGLIQAAVDRMPREQRAALIARHATRSEPCDCDRECCTGEKITRTYRDALTHLIDWSFAAAPAGIDRQTRAMICRAYFEQIRLAVEFERRKVARSTGHDAKKRIWDALKTLETDAQNRVTQELDWLCAPA